MDTDFEQQYQAAERAYGLGDYTEAHALTLGLWDRLQLEQNNQPQDVFLGWSAVVALLLGHIQLHGLHLPAEAIDSYQRVLESEPEDTIAALAKQGLERCQAATNSIQALDASEEDGSLPDLLKDPLLTGDLNHSKPALPNVATAMPWLHGGDNASEPNRDEQSVLTPAFSTEPTVAPGGDTSTTEDVLPAQVATTELVTEEEPETNSPESLPEKPEATEPTVEPEGDASATEDALQEKVATNELATGTELLKGEEEPSNTKPESIAEKLEAKDLLEKAWLRRQLNRKAEIKNPTDSGEPMGLMNRIKGVFVRSAGR